MSDPKTLDMTPASGRSRNSYTSIQSRLVAESAKIEKSKARINELKAKEARRIQKIGDSMGYYQYKFSDDELRGVFSELIEKKREPKKPD